jgi:negative regulator of flagellin synthesis FlgM
MTIGRVDSIEPMPSGKKPGRSGQVSQSEKTDSISLSSEARERAEVYQVKELIMAAPDVRADRIAEMKKKINDPSYINETILKATADKILDVWGI